MIRLGSSAIRVGRWGIMATLFGLAYGQNPLYTHNQNTYFAHGLARGGYGLLAGDWFANTADPFPVFSALVSFTYRHLPDWTFYLYYLIILGIYIVALLGIGEMLWPAGGSPLAQPARFLLLTLLHSKVFAVISERWLGLDLRQMAHYGLASQYILGPVFQPSVSGVFLVLSILFFLRRRPFVAVALACLAPAVHSSYLVSAGVLVISYLVMSFWESKMLRRPALLGALALLLVLPVIVYNYVVFRPTSPALFAQAQAILVDYRIPHHARPAHWFDYRSVLTIGLILAGLFLARKTRIFFILLIPACAALLLTVIQIYTGNKGLALLFPWRISALLAPIATGLLAARLTVGGIMAKVKAPRYVGVALWMVSLAAVILAVAGIQLSIEQIQEMRCAPEAGVSRFATENGRPDQLYLIPLRLDNFRLAAGVPVLVDYKSHPYRDIELLEWYNRLQLAGNFYQAAGNEACDILRNIADQYSVTHVVMPGGVALECPFTQTVFEDDAFRIFAIVL